MKVSTSQLPRGISTSSTITTNSTNYQHAQPVPNQPIQQFQRNPSVPIASLHHFSIQVFISFAPHFPRSPSSLIASLHLFSIPLDELSTNYTHSPLLPIRFYQLHPIYAFTLYTVLSRVIRQPPTLHYSWVSSQQSNDSASQTISEPRARMYSNNLQPKAISSSQSVNSHRQPSSV